MINGMMPSRPVECYIGPDGFPVSGVQPTGNTVWHIGLTKREEFAKEMMQSLCQVYKDDPWQWIAEMAVKAADALLAELAKGGTQ